MKWHRMSLLLLRQIHTNSTIERTAMTKVNKCTRNSGNQITKLRAAPAPKNERLVYPFLLVYPTQCHLLLLISYYFTNCCVAKRYLRSVIIRFFVTLSCSLALTQSDIEVNSRKERNANGNYILFWSEANCDILMIGFSRWNLWLLLKFTFFKFSVRNIVDWIPIKKLFIKSQS